MDIQIIQVPYDSSRRDWRMGAGPGHFLNNGLDEALRIKGHRVTTSVVESQDPEPGEIKTAFELYRGLAKKVRESRLAGSFPVVLSGNCGAALGSVSGIPADPVGIIWFDAHGDFNTPDTTASGFLDGMGLAIACGQGWQKLAHGIPGYRQVMGEHVLHVGGSDIEPDEFNLMMRSQAQVITSADIHAKGIEFLLPEALFQLKAKVKTVYLHLDLDVLDPKQTPANHFPAKDGLPVETVKTAIRLIKEQVAIGAVGVASYDPYYDTHGNTLRAGMALVEAVVG